MHGNNLEFGNFIPGKFCFWREIFAILRGNLSLRWIFWCVFLVKKSENLFVTMFPGNVHFFQPCGLGIKLWHTDSLLGRRSTNCLRITITFHVWKFGHLWCDQAKLNLMIFIIHITSYEIDSSMTHKPALWSLISEKRRYINPNYYKLLNYYKPTHPQNGHSMTPSWALPRRHREQNVW